MYLDIQFNDIENEGYVYMHFIKTNTHYSNRELIDGEHVENSQIENCWRAC